MPSDDLVKYFIKHTNDRFDGLDKKVDQLIGMRWMLIGAASVVSLIATFVIEIAKSFAGSR